jgi:hypothetical protein
MENMSEFIRFSNCGAVGALAKWVKPEKAVFPFT